MSRNSVQKSTNTRMQHDLLINENHDIFQRQVAPGLSLPLWTLMALNNADGLWYAYETVVAIAPANVALVGVAMDPVNTVDLDPGERCFVPIVTRGPVAHDLIPNRPDAAFIGGAGPDVAAEPTNQLYGFQIGLITLEWVAMRGGNTGARTNGSGGWHDI